MLDIPVMDNTVKEQFIITEEIKKLIRNRTIIEVRKRAKSFHIICMIGIWGKNNPVHSKKTMLALNNDIEVL